MRFSARSSLACALLLPVLLGALAPASVAVAAPVAAATSTLRIEIAVVRAGHGERSVDPALAAFAADLRSLPYERFSRVDSRSVPTTAGARQEIALSGGLRAVVTVDTLDDTGATTTIALYRNDREITHTTVKRPWGRAQVISVGKDGDDVMVVPIAVVR